MSITDQQLPQHPAPFPPLHVPNPRGLDAVVHDLRAEHDETVRGLKTALAKVTEERDHAQQQVRGMQAATEALVAEDLRREQRLEAELRAKNRIITGLEGLLDDDRAENHRLREHVARLVADNTGLNRLLEVVNTAREERRFPGVRRRDR